MSNQASLTEKTCSLINQYDQLLHVNRSPVLILNESRSLVSSPIGYRFNVEQDAPELLPHAKEKEIQPTSDTFFIWQPDFEKMILERRLLSRDPEDFLECYAIEVVWAKVQEQQQTKQTPEMQPGTKNFTDFEIFQQQTALQHLAVSFIFSAMKTKLFDYYHTAYLTVSGNIPAFAAWRAERDIERKIIALVAGEIINAQGHDACNLFLRKCQQLAIFKANPTTQ